MDLPKPVSRCFSNAVWILIVVTGGIVLGVAPCFGQPKEAVPEKDFIISAVEASIEQTLKELKFEHVAEGKLFVLAAMSGKVTVPPVKTLSVTFIQPSPKEGLPTFTSLEKRFETDFTLRWSRLSSGSVKNPVGLISESKIVGDQIVVTERAYTWTDEKGWEKASDKSMGATDK